MCTTRRTADESSPSSSSPADTPVSSSPDDGIKAEHAKAYIEDRTRASIAAINARDFDPSHPGWTAYTPIFSCGPIVRYQPNSPLQLKTTTHNTSVAAMLEIVRAFTEANPGYRCRLVDLLTCVDEKNLFAESYVMMEDLNVPQGTVKQIVAKRVWRWLKGEWRCVDYRLIAGLDGLGGLDA